MVIFVYFLIVVLNFSVDCTVVQHAYAINIVRFSHGARLSCDVAVSLGQVTPYCTATQPVHPPRPHLLPHCNCIVFA
jgi:hypothetical protein